MAFKDVQDSVKAGQAIVVGIIVIAVTLSIGLFIVTQLNTTSNGVLAPAVEIVNKVVGPIGGGLQFLGLAFLVMVAVVIIKILQSGGGE